MPKIRTNYPFMDEIREDYCLLVKQGKVNSRTKIPFVCKAHGEYWQTIENHMGSRHGCPACGKEQQLIKQRRTEYPFFNEMRSDFVEKIKNGEINSKEKVPFVCEKHGDYWRTLNDRSNGKKGCPKCVREAQIRTSYSFINEIRADYRELVIKGSIKQTDIIPFICEKHGEYWQQLQNHVNGKGCLLCGNEKRKRTEYPFFNEIRADYRKLVKSGQLGSTAKIPFICEKHGEYWQKLGAHTLGQGCPRCVIDSRIRTDYPFINEVREDYKPKIQNGEIKNNREKVPFICQEHGEYWQTLLTHLQGHGCPICNMSRDVKDFKEFLESIYTDTMLINDRTQIAPKEIDFYLPDVKIGFEFNDIATHKNRYGDDKIGKVRRYHIDKSIKCWERNIRLFHIWDLEWRNPRIRPILESVIKHALGKTKNRIYARDCDIMPVKSKEANAFFEENHIQGKATAKGEGSGYYALKHKKAGEMVGCLCQTVEKGILTVSRMAFKKDTLVVGGQSKLFSIYKPGQTVEYLVLNDYFGGNSFNATDWERIGWHEMNKIYYKETDTAGYASAVYYSKRKKMFDEGTAYRFYTSGTTRYRKTF